MSKDNVANFDYKQYRQDAEYSKTNPLPRRLLPEFEAVGIEIEVFALPGFEKNPDRFILSQSNTAKAVGTTNNYIINFLASPKVKPRWAKGFRLLDFKVDGSKKPVKGVPSKISLKYWKKEEKRGNELAEAILEILEETSLKESVAIAFGVDRAFDQRAYDRISTAERVILDKARKWELHFDSNWQKEACRVTGYPWSPSLPMARFISQTIYKPLPKDVYDRLMKVNAKRNKRHFQYFEQEADEKILKQHIAAVYMMLRLSQSKPEFWRHFRNYYGEGFQLEFDLGI